MYDVSDRASFIKLESWLNELEMYSTRSGIVKMIVGNKIDKVCIAIIFRDYLYGYTITSTYSGRKGGNERRRYSVR